MPRILFANLPLRLVMPKDRLAAAAVGVRDLVFRTVPSANKIEVRRMLERLYGLPVAQVNTANFEGKKKRNKGGFHRLPDWKACYVKLRETVKIPYTPPPPKAEGEAKAKAK